MKVFAVIALALSFTASARPMRRAAFTKQNGLDAIALNNKFKNLKANSACKSGDNACIGGKFAQCDNGKFVITACPAGTTCAALPLVNKPGTSIACDTKADIDARIAATGAKGNNAADTGANDNGGNKGNNNGGNKGGNNGGGNAQTSLTLDKSVIAKGFANDGQDVPEAGQVPSLTSTNNFINFCKGKGPITNGQQVKTGSCNPAPIGQIPSTENMPSSKFVFPKNFQTVKANTNFTIKMAIRGMETGFFVNAKQNYFAAPQQLNGGGQIKGHSHVVIEKLTSLTQTKPTDPNVFVKVQI